MSTYSNPNTNNKEKDCVYFFRMNGCSHCENLKPIWEEVVSKFKNKNSSIKFIVVESKEIPNMDKYATEKLKPGEILGYPDLRILTKNGKTSSFQSSRTVEDLVKWINTNIPEKEKSSTHYKSVINRVPTPHPNKKNVSRRSVKGGKKSRKRRKTRRSRKHMRL